MARQTPKAKYSGHPYAAIEHRVIDSEAFADLKPTSIQVLLIMVRQLTKDNNGHLQATWSYCRQRGVGSENTLRLAIRDLIAHGIVIRTKSRGPNKAWARYGVTWLSIKKSEGLYLDAWQPEAWKFWNPSKKQVVKFAGLAQQKPSNYPRIPTRIAAKSPLKSDDYELVPCIGGCSDRAAPQQEV